MHIYIYIKYNTAFNNQQIMRCVRYTIHKCVISIRVPYTLHERFFRQKNFSKRDIKTVRL